MSEIITRILDQFAKEEIGNRLSQFAMIALKEMILNELKNIGDSHAYSFLSYIIEYLIDFKIEGDFIDLFTATRRNLA